LLINSILTVPYFSIIFPVFYCNSNTLFSYSLLNSKQCYDVTHIIALIFGLFSLFMLVAIKGACIVLLYERNPLKNNIYACDSNISLLFKIGINILSIWYFIVDPTFFFKPLYIGGLVLIYG